MGAARLLAKGWVVFALYVGGLAALGAVHHGVAIADIAQRLGVCTALFAAMGLLFIGGYGISAGLSVSHTLSRLKPVHLAPGFNDLVFVAFALFAFCVQTGFAPQHPEGSAISALQGASRFAVFGQHVLGDKLAACGLDGSRVLASAFAWLLAFIFLGSALSRMRLAAAIVRFERKARPEALGPQALAFALGLAAVFGIQALYMGTAYTLMPCKPLGGLVGDALIGLGPLMLAYLIFAAVTNLLALGPEA